MGTEAGYSSEVSIEGSGRATTNDTNDTRTVSEIHTCAVPPSVTRSMQQHRIRVARAKSGQLAGLSGGASCSVEVMC